MAFALGLSGQTASCKSCWGGGNIGLPSFGDTKPFNNSGLPSFNNAPPASKPGLKIFSSQIEKKFIFGIQDPQSTTRFNVSFQVAVPGKPVTPYKMEVVNKNGNVIKTACSFPNSAHATNVMACSWNGTDQSCALVASGDYMFRVSYGKGYKKSVESEYFQARLVTDNPAGYHPSCDVTGA